MRRVGIKDVAREAGVSINTVSRALNDKPDIRSETKEKVLEAAVRLGYRPNRLAKGLRSNKSGTIGVIVTDVANPFFGALVKGVERAARDHDYSIILQDTDEDYEQEEEAIQVMLAEQVDGLLITPVQTRKQTIEKLAKVDFPFVLLSRYFDDLETDYVVPDDFQGGFVATEHLLQQGHTKIAIVNGPLHISSAKERFQGSVEAFKHYGITLDQALVRTGALTVEEGYSLTHSLLKRQPRPTAIVAYSDFVAFGIMRAIHEAGLSIPEDVAVVGFDDVEFASCLNVPLTTVKSPTEKLSRQAIEILAARTSGRNPQANQGIKLAVELIARESTSRKIRTN